MLVSAAVAAGFVIRRPSVAARRMLVRAAFTTHMSVATTHMSVTAARAAFTGVCQRVAAEPNATVELRPALFFVAGVTDFVALLTATGTSVRVVAIRPESSTVRSLFTVLRWNTGVDARLEGGRTGVSITFVARVVTFAGRAASSVGVVTQSPDRLALGRTRSV